MSPRVSSAKQQVVPTHEQIAERAFYVFLERSRRGGSGTPQADWEQAERQLRAELREAPATRARKSASPKAKKPTAKAKAAASGRVDEAAGPSRAEKRTRKS